MVQGESRGLGPYEAYQSRKFILMIYISFEKLEVGCSWTLPVIFDKISCCRLDLPNCHRVFSEGTSEYVGSRNILHSPATPVRGIDRREKWVCDCKRDRAGELGETEHQGFAGGWWSRERWRVGKCRVVRVNPVSARSIATLGYISDSHLSENKPSVSDMFASNKHRNGGAAIAFR